MAESKAAINMARRIRNKTRKLPAIIDNETSAKCWEVAWNLYIDDLKNMGAEDPNRVLPAEFMHEKCVI
jgi:hypothetical protein